MTDGGPDIVLLAWRVGRGVLLAMALAWLGALVILWTFQRNLLYMAPQQPPGAPPDGYQSVRLRTEDGLVLTAWYRPPDPGQPTVILFPGQGASLAWSADWSRGFAEAGFGMLLVSFRGFDANPGTPTERGLYRDGRAAIAWLAAEGEPRPVLAGVSLGSGVAAEMAIEAAARTAAWPPATEPRALILLSPYRSIPAVAAARYPLFPVRPLVKDRFDTESKIGAVRLPVLVIHGEDDQLIPFPEGVAVYRAAPPPKRFVALPGIGHEYPSLAVLPAVQGFLAETGSRGPGLTPAATQP